QWRENDIPYVLALVWAFVGINNSQADTALVANVAWLASILLILAVIVVYFLKRRSTRMT
ncbi:MAG: hypothetical protein H8D34_34430, partial [Chloroflexi bacterium]|nr:hypothetical protein [Chloroflexota bacterium]